MGQTLDKELATERFGRALVLARSEEELPEEWLTRAREVGRAKSKTFTPMLGTALLARATSEDVDVRTLREDESERGYSARSFAKDVLVPCCARAGIDLRSSGAEPLNNQPFLRAGRVSMDLRVKKAAVPELQHLCECLDEVEALRARAALNALAAFLRVRIEASGADEHVTLGSNALPLQDLLSLVDATVAGDESGAVAVAIAAASFSLVFRDVRARAPKDPTSTPPGEVAVFHQGKQLLAIDARLRSFTEAEALIRAGRLAAADVRHGVVLLLVADIGIDVVQLQHQAARLHEVELSFFFKASEIVRTAMMMSPEALPTLLGAFPRRALLRMQEMGVPVEHQQAWSAPFDEAAPS